MYDVIFGPLTIDNEFPVIFQGRICQLRVFGPACHRLPVVRGMRPEHQRGHRHVPVVQKLQQKSNWIILGFTVKLSHVVM